MFKVYAMSKLGMQGAVCVPNNISPTKEAALTSRGARLIKHGADCVEAENFARKMSLVRFNVKMGKNDVVFNTKF